MVSGSGVQNKMCICLKVSQFRTYTALGGKSDRIMYMLFMTSQSYIHM